MKTNDFLLKRHSCRHFTEEKVSQENIDLIVEAGLNAPCGKNRQDSKIVVVEDENLIKELSNLNASIMGTTSDPFYGAKTIICVFVKKDSTTLVQDGSAIITMMQSEAFILGVGSCWINRLKQMMETPIGIQYMRKWNIEEYEGVGICIIGMPLEEGKAKVIKENRVIRL